MQQYTIPKLYFSGYIRNFEPIAESMGLHKRKVSKGDVLTEHGVINNTTHYIVSGIMHLSLTHSSGNTKSMTFFGPETIFPIGVVPHENLIDYEMVLTALSDMEVISFPYPMLRDICVHNGEVAAEILEENCDFIGYLFYRDMNHSFAPTQVRVCEVLYLYWKYLCPRSNTLPLTQSELTEWVGISKPQLERVLKNLREQGIIITGRNFIEIPDPQRLLAFCSDDVK